MSASLTPFTVAQHVQIKNPQWNYYGCRNEAVPAWSMALVYIADKYIGVNWCDFYLYCTNCHMHAWFLGILCIFTCLWACILERLWQTSTSKTWYDNLSYMLCIYLFILQAPGRPKQGRQKEKGIQQTMLQTGHAMWIRGAFFSLFHSWHTTALTQTRTNKQCPEYKNRHKSWDLV